LIENEKNYSVLAIWREFLFACSPRVKALEAFDNIVAGTGQKGRVLVDRLSANPSDRVLLTAITRVDTPRIKAAANTPSANLSALHVIYPPDITLGSQSTSCGQENSSMRPRS
jgi:hypothetical protein